MKYELNAMHHVGTAAYGCSANNDYLDMNSNRKSAVLSYKRLKASHAYEEIGKALFSLHNMYNLSSDLKIVCPANVQCLKLC